MWEKKGRPTDEADDTDENLEFPDMFASAQEQTCRGLVSKRRDCHHQHALHELTVLSVRQLPDSEPSCGNNETEGKVARVAASERG